MIAIDIEMPESCVRCFTKGLRGLVGCELLTDDIGIHVGIRHSDCPLKEIVTCKDCKYYRNKDDDEWCTNHSIKDNKFWVREDYFCADAERRE